MTYHMAKLGDWPNDTVWNPGAGQTPRNDPRIVKAYSTVRGTWTPSGISRTTAPSVPGLLKAQVQSRLPGWTVKSAGWNAAGQVEISVVVPSDTAAGVIKGAFFDAGDAVNSQRAAGGFLVLGTTASGTPAKLINPMTYVNATDIKLPSSSTTTPSTTPDATTTPSTTPDTTTPTTTDTTTSDQPFYMKSIAGLPVWAIGIGGIALVGVLGFTALRKKPAAASKPAAAAAVVANRRRRHRRR